MMSFYARALRELGAVFTQLDDGDVQQALALIQRAQRIALYGVGREGLQVKGFAMRLCHLGLRAAVVGEMSAPPIGPGDVLIVSAGPGWFSTVEALLTTARRAGAATLCVTARPDGVCARLADRVIILPAQTMAEPATDDGSVLPLGSLYEGAQYLLFEAMIVRLRTMLAISPATLAANHTNLE
ncbi:SIS domain-containing protein [Affinibrenneria salicis]|uniref:SIS domain-containing protein n=1 Tax=Affinibrenneria salicis TaxID=2590031 RepID=A0A5J5G3Q1_9GAMM|nr:SIS domain-containing protein [Affinibrenneria salicis]KAA9001281.1 SIS domain-containing protein [Affinibrenneria salicis]